LRLTAISATASSPNMITQRKRPWVRARGTQSHFRQKYKNIPSFCPAQLNDSRSLQCH